MWALVRANRQKTSLLAGVSLVVAAAAGFFLGAVLARPLGYLFGAQPIPGFSATGGLIGIEFAIVLWVLVTVVIYLQGDKLILAAAGAEPVEQAAHRRYYNVVEEMSIAAGLGRMPKPHIIHEQAMNAFATGMRPDSTAIAVTTGALARLNRDQLQGLVAHEIAKIANGDVLFLSLVSLMTGAVFARRNPGRDALARNPRYQGLKSQVSWGQALLRSTCGSLVLLAPVYAVLIVAGVVRRRVYLADACAALYTRFPEGLAQALHVVSGDPYSLVQANRGIATLCTVNPYRKEEGIHTPFVLGATHPPTHRRVAILRRIHGGVSLGAYQRAWQQETHARTKLIPQAAIAEARPVPMRAASEEAAQAVTQQRSHARAAGDIVRRLNDFIFLTCACGLKIKLPPQFPHDHVGCPRCGQPVALPVARTIQVSAVAEALETADAFAEPTSATRPTTALPTLTITRTDPDRWLTFKCTCGAKNQVSPGFDARFHTCPGCHKKIAIEEA